jgi:tRNA 5-methylaminomethyl-2-thiouridine biosynthesis bifunctional protein
MTAADQQGYLLEHANIGWENAETPWSAAFGDIYWNRQGGLAEKQFVFIEANNLQARWQALQQSNFTIVETGFGFGLNFLLAARLWQQVAPKGKLLHYLAIENAPVAPADLGHLYAALAPTPSVNETTERAWQADQQPAAPLAELQLAELQLAELATAVLDKYPLPAHGMHPLWITDNICLTLIYADVDTAASMLTTPVDAFFLDGFSPSQNSAMWEPELFCQWASLSHEHTTLSTYSVAGKVKRGLQAAGFAISKVPGFAGKAQMLTARLAAAPAELPTLPMRTRPNRKPAKVIVIGAGLAGLHCAAALLRRGMTVEVLEAKATPLAGASGIAQLAVYPQLAAAPDNRARFSLAAFLYLQQQGGYQASGFSQTPDTPVLKDRLARICDYFPESFARLTASPAPAGAAGTLHYASGGWLNAAQQLAATLAAIQLRCASPVATLQRVSGVWQLLDAQQQVLGSAETVIIATGAGSLAQLAPLQLGTSRGQAMRVRHASGTGQRSVLSGPVSLFPSAADGWQTISGTHQRDQDSVAVRPADNAELLSRLSAFLPGETEPGEAWAGVRATSRDRLPVVGGVPDWAALQAWCQQHRRQQPAFADYQPGLYVCTALGSHGATHAPLCGEYLARLINHEPLPFEPRWCGFLGAERFMQRDLSRLS